MGQAREADGAFAESIDALVLLRKFADAVLALLRNTLEKYPWEPRRRQVVEFKDVGEWEYREVIESDYGGFFRQYLFNDELWNLPAAVEFGRWCHANGGVPGLALAPSAYEKSFDFAKTFVIPDLLALLGSLQIAYRHARCGAESSQSTLRAWARHSMPTQGSSPGSGSWDFGRLAVFRRSGRADPLAGKPWF